MCPKTPAMLCHLCAIATYNNLSNTLRDCRSVVASSCTTCTLLPIIRELLAVLLFFYKSRRTHFETLCKRIVFAHDGIMFANKLYAHATNYLSPSQQNQTIVASSA